MKIALIGANGQLGTDFSKVKSDHEFVNLTLKELDITDHDMARKLFEAMKPDLIINMAALTNLEFCEANPYKAFDVNAIAQKNLSDIARDINAGIVFYSTDYVFGRDESRNKPYIETDKRGPVNVYATSKTAAEDMTIFSNPKYYIIRIAVLFGAAGSEGKGGNFIESMIKLGKEKGEVKVVNDQIVSPTYTTEVVENTLKLIETGKYGIYHMTGQGQCSFFEFANKIFELTGMKVKCEPISINEFKVNHKKPKFTVLENKALKDLGIDMMSPWETMLEKYLKEKKYI